MKKNAIISKFQTLIELEQRFQKIIEIADSSQAKNELNVLQWAINELYDSHCVKVLLIIGADKFTELDMTKQRSGKLTSIIEIDPSKYEISLIRNYIGDFESEIHHQVFNTDFFICDRFFNIKINPDNKIIYVEAFVPKNVLIQIGNKELKFCLKKWLLKLWKTSKEIV